MRSDVRPEGPECDLDPGLLADLLVEGTPTRDSARIAEELQALGATLAATAGNDGISVRASGLASGASTLAALLARFHDIDDGTIRIFDIDTGDVLHELAL